MLLNKIFKFFYFRPQLKYLLNLFVQREIKHELYFKIIKFINGDTPFKEFKKLDNY